MKKFKRRAIYCNDVDKIKKLSKDIKALGFDIKLNFDNENVYIDVILNYIKIEFIYLNNINYKKYIEYQYTKSLNMYVLDEINEKEIEKEFIYILNCLKDSCELEESVYTKYSLNDILNDLKNKIKKVANICKKYNLNVIEI